MAEQQNKMSKAQRQALNDKKAARIIKWIFAGLIALGLIFMINSFYIIQ